MRDFSKIPGISPALAQHCTERSRKFTALDNRWMEADNRYWFGQVPAGLGGFMSGIGADFFAWVQDLRRQHEPGFDNSPLEGVAGFQVGDSVRLFDESSDQHGLLHIVARIDAKSETLCLER